jgi:glycolate oxidase
LLNSEIIRELKCAAGKANVVTDVAERAAYAYDSQPEKHTADVIVHCESAARIAGVLRVASKYGIPAVARGAGSGMTGGAVPESGGIVINLERMNRILRIDAEDRIGYCQPGVITSDFQRAAERLGLFYPPEPASAQFSSLGGNVEESAGGLTTVRYGLTKHYVAGLEFVTAAGTVVRTGIYTGFQSPFDVGALMVGSEGTLGIVTEIALRLIPLPRSKRTVLAFFGNLADTMRASNAVRASGVDPSVLEFMDRSCIDTVKEYAGVAVPEGTGALLLVELDGAEEDLGERAEVVMAALKSHNPVEVKTASGERERAALWKLRKSTSPAIARIAPLKYNEDICVPISKIPVMCEFVEELGRRREVRVVSFGHSGDGNLHINFMTSPQRPEEVARVKAAVEELFRETVRLGGTLSGEHGIGMMKRPYLGIALDGPTIAYEKAVKRALDPENMLNPGKIFPE